MLNWSKDCEDSNLFKFASIGKGPSKKNIPQIRGDKIHWLENFTSNSGPLIASIFNELVEISRKEFYLPAKRFECHFAKFETGSFYKLHCDRHSRSPGRIMSVVIYLRSNESGGELILHDNDLNKITIQPKAGKIVVFDSYLKHEVLTSLGDRWSLAGWIRSDLHPGIRL